MSLLVISEILGLLVDTWTVDDKYSLRKSENLLKPIKMQLPQKQTNFSEYFAAIQKSASAFDYFGKKDGPHSLCISVITDCER